MFKRIYIVDDDEPVRRSLLALLTLRTDFQVGSFDSGDAFLAEMGELEPGVVLLDVRMPGLSGMEVLAEINREEAPFLCVIITGHGNIAMAVEAMKSGAIDFLEKPYDHSALIDTIERAFDRLTQAGADAARIAAAQESIARLAPREVDVLRGLIAGKVNKVIAHELDISPRTVEVYRAHLMTKLRVRSLPDALRIAFAAGLVD
jgi:two-component system response regulator FixJ